MQKRNKLRYFLQGITLIETVLATALVVIVVSVAAVSLHAWQRAQQLHISTDAVESVWNEARHVAPYLGGATLCGSRDGIHCDGGWQCYWLLQSPNGDILHKLAWTANAVQVALDSSFGRNEAIHFNQLGETGQQGSFKLCRGSRCETLLFINSGRLRRG